MKKAYLITTLLMVTMVTGLREARAFSEANVSGTYGFTFQATATDPGKLCNGAQACGGVDNVSGSLGRFYKRFAADLKAGACKAASSQLKAASSKIAAASAKAGDRFYAVGDLVADGSGKLTDGTATFNSTSLNGEVINFSGLGTQAVVCGGADVSGLCKTLCATNSPTSALNCSANGGYAVSGNGGTAVVYIYPQLAGGQCGPGTTTADECCNDPSLVILAHMAVILENLNGSQIAQRIRGVVTDQGDAGTVDATLAQ